MNTLDLMWFIPSVISNIEIRAYMVICLLTLCLHLPHLYQYTSGLLNLFFFFFLDFYQVLTMIVSCLSTNFILCC